MEKLQFYVEKLQFYVENLQFYVEKRQFYVEDDFQYLRQSAKTNSRKEVDRKSCILRVVSRHKTFKVWLQSTGKSKKLIYK